MEDLITAFIDFIFLNSDYDQKNSYTQILKNLFKVVIFLIIVTIILYFVLK